MKKFIILVLQVSLLLAFCSCSNETQGNDYDHLEYLTGKVVETKDDNTVLVQITKERNNYKVDDKVYVHYDEAVLKDKAFEFESSEGILNSGYKLVLGDEVYVQSFPKSEYKKIDGYDYRECDGPIYKYVTVASSSANLAK